MNTSETFSPQRSNFFKLKHKSENQKFWAELLFLGMRQTMWMVFFCPGYIRSKGLRDSSVPRKFKRNRKLQTAQDFCACMLEFLEIFSPAELKAELKLTREGGVPPNNLARNTNLLHKDTRRFPCHIQTHRHWWFVWYWWWFYLYFLFSFWGASRRIKVSQLGTWCWSFVFELPAKILGWRYSPIHVCNQPSIRFALIITLLWSQNRIRVFFPIEPNLT